MWRELRMLELRVLCTGFIVKFPEKYTRMYCLNTLGKKSR
jgi:hypothetical protein